MVLKNGSLDELEALLLFLGIGMSTVSCRKQQFWTEYVVDCHSNQLHLAAIKTLRASKQLRANYMHPFAHRSVSTSSQKFQSGFLREKPMLLGHTHSSNFFWKRELSHSWCCHDTFISIIRSCEVSKTELAVALRDVFPGVNVDELMMAPWVGNLGIRKFKWCW